jgi:hypothetical protein
MKHLKTRYHIPFVVNTLSGWQQNNVTKYRQSLIIYQVRRFGYFVNKKFVLYTDHLVLFRRNHRTTWRMGSALHYYVGNARSPQSQAEQWLSLIKFFVNFLSPSKNSRIVPRSSQQCSLTNSFPFNQLSCHPTLYSRRSVLSTVFSGKGKESATQRRELH